jgi:hypothetical protein
MLFHFFDLFQLHGNIDDLSMRDWFAFDGILEERLITESLRTLATFLQLSQSP